MDCALPELMEVIKRVDVITINDEEASNFLENILLLRLLPNSNHGSKYVVIKGRAWSSYFHDKDVLLQHTIRRSI
jgi:hypothetical protein